MNDSLPIGILQGMLLIMAIMLFSNAMGSPTISRLTPNTRAAMAFLAILAMVLTALGKRI